MDIAFFQNHSRRQGHYLELGKLRFKEAPPHPSRSHCKCVFLPPLLLTWGMERMGSGPSGMG